MDSVGIYRILHFDLATLHGERLQRLGGASILGLIEAVNCLPFDGSRNMREDNWEKDLKGLHP
ncbi:MAG: hypothetical protein KC964_24730, partial [Candidatus Omnitrophica bacterium]|nr:hypothetical protein [Candidatus Omnitrophota bacterium]